MKNVDQLARSRAKDHRTSLLGPCIEIQYRVLEMRARSFPRLRDYLCAVQDAQCNTEKPP